MQRISIIGNTGAGKSTLAQRLAEELDLEWTSIDSHIWLPGWKEKQHDEAIEEFKQLVQRDRWVMEGNFGWLRPTIWERADTVIWLDYPLRVSFGRLLKRTVRRIKYKELVCNGNVESLGRALGRESILLWSIKSFHKNRRSFPEWIARPEYQHLKVLIFKNADETEKWFNRLALCGTNL